MEPSGYVATESNQPATTSAEPAAPARDASPEGAVSDEVVEDLGGGSSERLGEELTEEDLARYVEEALAELGAFPTGDIRYTRTQRPSLREQHMMKLQGFRRTFL